MPTVLCGPRSALQLLLDHLSEALRSEGVLEVQASPDLVDFVRRDGRLDPLAVEALARRVFGIQRQGLRMQADQRVGPALRVSA